MRKRIGMITMAAIVTFSLGCQCIAIDSNGSKELLDSATSAEIFSRYAEEISDIEEEYGVVITGYTEEVSDLIKQAAMDAYNTEKFVRRSQLATELAMDKYEQTRVNPRVSTYLGTEEVTSYGPIKGIVLQTIAPGVTTSVSVKEEVTVKFGEVIGGITFSGTAAVEVSTTASGPADGATLGNGQRATHRLVTGVLFGVVVKHTYVDVDPWTGTQIGDPYYEYEIIDEAGIAYTHLAQISNPTYVEKATSSKCISDTNYNVFKENLKNNPGRYI